MSIKKYVIGFAIALFLVWIITDAVTRPGPHELEGNFKEVAMYRNENNTGPIVRIYAVTLSDTLWQEMKKYGDLMPHTKYGNTKVYFFLNNSLVPKELIPGKDNLSPDVKSYCLAVYEKDAMGVISFRKRPFNN
ncbi:MAG: hypothetical protein EOO01_15545 [Chitinophagaceae bacterium]|nr:MAG: hypothetical protein EOO01_15545 [Chitinophagaceae bacterium]